MSNATVLAVCLLGASSVIILKAAGHQQAGEPAAASLYNGPSPQAVSEPEDAIVVNSASKADKLPVAPFVNPTEVVKIERQAAPNDQKMSAPVKAEVTSWHWNARSNKVTRK